MVRPLHASPKAFKRHFVPVRAPKSAFASVRQPHAKPKTLLTMRCRVLLRPAASRTMTLGR
jgi:hypothetical protein